MAELAIGGLFAAPVLKVLVDKIVSVTGGQITLQKNFKKDLERMKAALTSVESVLEDAERRSITDKLTRLWLKELKVAMYAISDMIEEFQISTQEANAEPSARKFSLKKHLPGLKIVPKTILANKMKTMRKDLEKITGQHKNFNLLVGTNANELKVPDGRETSSNMDHNQVFGRTKERDTILASLSENMNKEMIVLPIYGIGGLGKTTLAQMIYSSSQFKDYSHVWVYVSQIFDLKKIGNSIIAQLLDKDERKSFIPYTERQMIENSLAEIFAARKKILIVLDDLWEDKQIELDKLKDMLKLGNGSMVVVIVTTRNESIALEVCSIQPHKLAVLSPGMCWSIIKHKSDFGSRDDKEELEQIGMDIASKCGGVALAAQSLGYVLKSMMPRQWESIRDSDIWSVYASGDPSLTLSEDQSLNYVLASLRLSYSVMPSRLKLCFAYCAIFAKGHKIIKDDLIRQWISLSFIEPTNMFSSRELGDRYIRQLLGLSFLQDSESRWAAGVHLENATLFTMHDLVHDLARSVLVDEILIAGKHGNTGGSCCRYALLSDCSKPLDSSSKIRALRFMDCGKTELNGAAFSSAKSLRVLDLSECSIHKLPDSFSVLKQLRYLNAPSVQHSSIPDSITKLSKLIYLNLHGSSRILRLPESIGDIEGLMYLNLSGCSGIEKLPASLGRLNKLVHLDLSNCSRVGGVSVFLENFTELQYLNLSHCRNIGPLLSEALGGLSELQYLNLSFSSYLKRCQEAEVLGTFSKLEYLNLSSDYCDLQKFPEALGRCIKLKYLNLSGCRDMKELPASLRNLNNLVHLNFEDCLNVNGVPEALGGLTKLTYLNLSQPSFSQAGYDFEKQRLIGLPNVIGNLTELRYLNLSDCMGYIFGTHRINGIIRGDEFDSFMDRISTLSNLEILDLSRNSDIGSIPASFCNLRKMHTLNLSFCFGLDKLPDWIGTIDSLKTIYVSGCLQFLDQPHLSGSSVTLPCFAVHAGEFSSNLVLLQHTDPEELELTRLENVKSAEEAHHINLKGKQSMKVLRLRWTRDAERFVDDKMLLEKLVPPSTVKKFEIRDYNNASFPAWLMNISHYLPNLVSLKMDDMPNCNVLPPVNQLPNLNWLLLSRMDSLEEWNTSYSSGEEYVIETVFIYDCPKLRMSLKPPRAITLVINSSDNVLSSWGQSGDSSDSSVTTKLKVQGCKVPLHQWRLLRHHPGLTDLSIRRCSDLTGSPEIIQHLSSVQTLLLETNRQNELPGWLGELPSLQKLRIDSCTGLMELHENMRRLKKLQTIELSCCDKMASLPRWLGELTSLKELGIFECQGLRSLPESIQQLTNLQELRLHGCSKLEHLVESEENKTELTDMEERACVLPTSLKKLIIQECEGIRSLPEGIQQLTNLQELYIVNCHGLENWCTSEENKMKLAHIENREFLPELLGISRLRNLISQSTEHLR